MENYARHTGGLMRVHSLGSLNRFATAGAFNFTPATREIEEEKMEILSLREQQKMALQIKEELENKDRIIVEQNLAIENLSRLLDRCRKQLQKGADRLEVDTTSMKSVKKLTKEIWTLRTSVDKQTRLVTELSSSVSGLKKENNHLREKVGSLKYRLKSQKRNSPITLVEPIKENLFQKVKEKENTAALDTKSTMKFSSAGFIGTRRDQQRLPRQSIKQLTDHKQTPPISSPVRNFQTTPQFLKYVQDRLAKDSCSNRYELRQSILEEIRNVQGNSRRKQIQSIVY